MKFLRRRILVTSLVIGGAVLGINSSASAGPSGANRAYNGTSFISIRQKEYLGDFDWQNSRAAKLFDLQSREWTRDALKEAIYHVCEREKDITNPLVYLMKNKGCEYKFIEENYDIFESYMGRGELDQFRCAKKMPKV